MSSIGPALEALQSGNTSRAKAILTEAFDNDPGEAAALLARIALDEGEADRAEILSRTALEYGARQGVFTLADAVGRLGRRAEAEEIALNAITEHPDSGMLRAVLGEQRIRQAKWDLGTQDFIDALSLDGREAVTAQLHRVLRDLTIGHNAGKVPTARATAFINRVEGGAPKNDHQLALLFASSRRALAQGDVLEDLPARPAPRREPPPAAMRAMRDERQYTPPPAPPSPAASDQLGSTPRSSANLVRMIRRDRELNEALQEGLEALGLPNWPSKGGKPLDTIERMVPSLLNIDREEFQREHLNVTSGSVDAEIFTERALQSLMQSITASTAGAPAFDSAGLTKLETALWDGVLDRMAPIPSVYLGEAAAIDPRVLAIGAFLGACVINPGDATWSFERNAEETTIETHYGDLRPFDTAAQWLAATDKDDVHLEEFLGEAVLRARLNASAPPSHDPTEGLSDRALAMKLAEGWLDWRCNPLDTAQNEVADAIRPLNSLERLVFFAIEADMAPPMASGNESGSRYRGEVAIALLRTTGEFLCLGSRKHFARTIGELCGSIEARHVATITDMFSSFHRPSARIVRDGADKPRIETKGGATMLRFSAVIDKNTQAYALLHAPEAAVQWRLLRI